MNPKKCYICGCVRNCSKYLVNVFENIIKIASIFDEYKIVIAYDHSNDDSLDILLSLKEKYRNIIKIEIIINKNKLSPYRTFNISNARNSIIQYLLNDNDKSYEYFIMMDMDDVCSNLIEQPNILEKYLNHQNDWDSISFNRDDYYDVWALSIDSYLFSCWHFGDTIHSRQQSVHIIREHVVNSLKKLTENELLQCQSAFNGFALYKKEMFINCKYDGHIQNNISLLGNNLIRSQELKYNKQFNMVSVEDCEHRFFHNQAIQLNKAKIRISPLKMFKL